MEKVRQTFRNPWFALFTGVLLGLLTLLVIRFATYSPEYVHYHANFAVFLNGKREEFKGPQYYQDVAICAAGKGITDPEQRAHMHDNVNNVVHTHDHATTWGQFFNNLGWSVGGDFINTDTEGKFVASGNDKLHVIIDGQDYTDLTPITNMVIKDRSRVLLSFGDIDQATLQKEYKDVPSTAEHYDKTMDTSACSGAEKITFSDRLHHLF